MTKRRVIKHKKSTTKSKISHLASFSRLRLYLAAVLALPFIIGGVWVVYGADFLPPGDSPPNDNLPGVIWLQTGAALEAQKGSISVEDDPTTVGIFEGRIVAPSFVSVASKIGTPAISTSSTLTTTPAFLAIGTKIGNEKVWAGYFGDSSTNANAGDGSIFAKEYCSPGAAAGDVVCTASLGSGSGSSGDLWEEVTAGGNNIRKKKPGTVVVGTSNSTIPATLPGDITDNLKLFLTGDSNRAPRIYLTSDTNKNPEIDFQVDPLTGETEKHWGIYADKAKRELRLWATKEAGELEADRFSFTTDGVMIFKGYAAAGPVSTSITPSSGGLGKEIPVTIIGSNLTNISNGDVTVSPSSAGAVGLSVKANSVTNPNDTTVTFKLIISSDATNYKSWKVKIRNNVGSTEQNFNVGDALLISITPDSGDRNNNVSLKITGFNLYNPTNIRILTPAGQPCNGVTVSSFQSVDQGQINASVQITGSATLATCKVSVVTSYNNTSNTKDFTITPAAVPIISTITPTQYARGYRISTTITGSNLNNTSAVTFSDPNVTTVANSISSTEGSISLQINIAAKATLGAQTFTVTTPNSPTGTGSGSVTFTVNNSSVINSISPSGHSANGTAFTATIYGTNLTGATGVVFNSCTEVSVDNTSITSTTVSNDNDRVDFSMTVASGAADKSCTFTVNMPSGNVNSGTVTFDVGGGF
ncbi:MAG: hypothetical protein AAB657_00430 [Patescibacteria group bacterium]